MIPIFCRPSKAPMFVTLCILALTLPASDAAKRCLAADASPTHTQPRRSTAENDRDVHSTQPQQAARRFPGAAIVNYQPCFLTRVRADRDDGVYREGDRLKIEFISQREAVLYLLYHQADGRSLLLFPNSAQPDGRVPAKQLRQVPAASENFGIRIRPPFGREVIQVLATAQPLPELDKIARRTDTRPLVSQAVLDRLAGRLALDRRTWTEHRVPIETVPAGMRHGSAKSARIGLFIGIGKYLHPEIGATHEELRHSAEVMYKTMLRRGKLDPKLSKLVTDQDATRAALEELVARWLPSVSRPGDTVFIYFSGHAGPMPQMPNNAWDEQRVLLAPYDCDAAAPTMPIEARLTRLRNTCILDNTLARWLQELSGRQVVLILDTCHSGSMAQYTKQADLLAKQVENLKDVGQLNLVVMTCCAKDEQALFEGTPNKTMWYTYFLSEAINRLPLPVTTQAAFDYTREGMKKMLEARNEVQPQEPQMSDSALLPVTLAP
jgi:hypothetical protein